MLWALVAMAPAVVGYGLVYHLSRVLYALGGAKQAVIAASAGWLTVAALSWGLSACLSSICANRANAILLALGLAQSVGMSVGALGLLIGLRQIAGKPALRGVAPAAGYGFFLALGAGVSGWFISGYLMELWVNIFGTFFAAALAGIVTVAIMSPLLVRQLRERKNDLSTSGNK